MAEKIEILKKKYKGEWLAIEITKETVEGAIEGNLIARSKDREEILDKAPPRKDKLVYITFTGTPLKKGYAACFK